MSDRGTELLLMLGSCVAAWVSLGALFTLVHPAWMALLVLMLYLFVGFALFASLDHVTKGRFGSYLGDCPVKWFPGVMWWFWPITMLSTAAVWAYARLNSADEVNL